MPASRAIARLVAPACALLASVGLAGSQEPAQEKPAPPAFRGNINFVRVDAIVTDGDGRPGTDLQQTDFDVLEDGRLQTVEQFRVARIEQRPEADPPPIRDRHDEEREAARDDVRMFAIYVSPAIQAREY